MNVDLDIIYSELEKLEIDICNRIIYNMEKNIYYTNN